MKMSVRRVSVAAGPGESGDSRLDEQSVLRGESLREKIVSQDQELMHLRTEMKKLQKCLRLIVNQGKILHAAKSSKPPTCKLNVTKATGTIHENHDNDKNDDVIMSKTKSEANQTEYVGEQRLHQIEERLKMDIKTTETENGPNAHAQDLGDVAKIDKCCDDAINDDDARADKQTNLDEVMEDEYSFCGEKIQSKNFSSSSIVILQHCEELADGNQENSQNKDTDFEHIFVTVGVDTKDLDWENEKSILRKTNADLSRRLEKITEVNTTWDKFWSRKRTHFESVLADKDSKIRKLQFKVNKLQDKETVSKKQLHVINAEKEQILKDKDEMLLLTKTRIEKLEKTIEQLRKELSESNDKNDRAQKFARTLLQQKKEGEMEIKRLNKILEENVKEQKHLRLSATNHQAPDKVDSKKQQLNNLSSEKSDSKRKTAISGENIKHSDGEKRRESRRERSDPKKHSGQIECSKSGEICEGSLTKEELKEQIMHLKEQTNAYESDFRKERQDRERAVAKLQDMKEKLDETRQVQRKYKVPPKSHQPRHEHIRCCCEGTNHRCVDEHSRRGERTTNKKRTCLCPL